MQRGAKPKKPQVQMDDQREETLDDLSKISQNLAELSNLLRGLMQQQMEREAKWERE